MANIEGFDLPEMVPVVSSNISSIGYDPDEQLLYVEFHPKGQDFAHRLYMYFNVPQEVYDGFFNTDSVGSYFIQNIRHTQEFPYTRLM